MNVYEPNVSEINDQIARNISFLTKQNNISKKELESAIEISVGYTSKIRKLSAHNNLPGLNILIKIANYFEVSLEDLIFYDFENPNDINIESGFFKQIIDDTKKHRIIWEKDERKNILELIGNYDNSPLNKYFESDIEYIEHNLYYDSFISKSIQARLYVYYLKSDGAEIPHKSLLFHFRDKEKLLECPEELFYYIKKNGITENDNIIHTEMLEYIKSNQSQK